MKFFAFLLLVFPLILFSQSTDDYPYIEKHSFSIGGVLSFDKYNFQFTDDKSSNATNYSTGLSLKKTFNTNLEFRSGAFYSEKGFNRIEPVFFGPDFGFDVDYLIWAGYLDIPIQLGYRYPINRFITVVPSGGFVFGFLINKAVSSDIGDAAAQFDALTQGLQSTLYSFNVAAGVELHFSKKIFMNIEPYYRKGFNKIHNQFMESGPTSYGLGIGMFRKF